MKCPECGRKFEPESVGQDVCSVACVRAFVLKRAAKLRILNLRRPQ